MRMGPGKHLKGLKLMNGLVTPEEVRCSYPNIIILTLSPFDFSSITSTKYVTSIVSTCIVLICLQLIITQEIVRCGARGYGDGMPHFSFPYFRYVCLKSPIPCIRSLRRQSHWPPTITQLWHRRDEAEGSFFHTLLLLSFSRLTIFDSHNVLHRPTEICRRSFPTSLPARNSFVSLSQRPKRAAT